uniref:Uncharacterized protein n=1 Tax=Glossina palpalis gambiensis TaxID=67801 RepID=A0A1B0B3T5_9MUSC
IFIQNNRLLGAALHIRLTVIIVNLLHIPENKIALNILQVHIYTERVALKQPQVVYKESTKTESEKSHS